MCKLPVVKKKPIVHTVINTCNCNQTFRVYDFISSAWGLESTAQSLSHLRVSLYTAPSSGVPSCQYPGTAIAGRMSSVRFFYRIGENITFDCDPGLELRGTRMLKCLRHGKWSSAIPTCVLPGASMAAGGGRAIGSSSSTGDQGDYGGGGGGGGGAVGVNGGGGGGGRSSPVVQHQPHPSVEH